MWHLETDVFAIVILVFLLIKNVRLTVDPGEQRQWLMLVLGASIVLTVIDLASSYVMNGCDSWLVYEAAVVLYYATAACLPCVWLLYGFSVVTPGRVMTPLRCVVSVVPTVVVAAVSLSNPWTSVVFSLTPDMVYARGPLFYPIILIYQVYYPVVGLAWVIANRRRIEPRSTFFSLLAFFLVIPAATTAQLMLPGTLLTCLTYAVIYVADDLTIETERRNRLHRQLLDKNAELERAAREAEAANEAKTQFLSRISHDIRTPIGAILNLTDFARADKDDPVKLEGDLDRIGVSGRLLLSLINDVLDVSKIDAGKIELKREPYPYREYIETVRTILGPMCEEAGLTYQVNGHVPEEQALVCDRVRVDQITLNIVSNAVRYTPEGGSVTFSTSEERLEGGRYAFAFEVTDTGIGMSEQFQARMFEEFATERDNPLRKATTAGTGLGLPIVKRLVDLMGGTIDVRSRVGEGTTVVVRLPLDTVEVAPEEGGATDEGPTPGELAGVRVLFAEDNEINALIGRRIFEEVGVTADRAANGREALDMFCDAAPGTYAAVFMDIQMPVMDGYEATRAIRASGRPDADAIPIVAVTADAFTEARDKAMEVGMTDFTTKPLKADELRRLIPTS